jgi:hypothetical protein
MSTAPESPVKPVTETSEISNSAVTIPNGKELPPEYGGRKGLEATRFGDWEMNGKCVDF